MPRCKRAADTTFDDRSRGQVMADTLVERVTGRPADGAGAGRGQPGDLRRDAAGRRRRPGGGRRLRADPGRGARRLVGDAVTDERSRATLRRLYRHPDSRGVGGDGVAVAVLPEGVGRVHRAARPDVSHSVLRCADPAPRPRQPAPRGGPTSADNGLGDCEALQLRQGSTRLAGHTPPTDGVHTAEFVTPTGATYQSTAPPLPGPPVRRRLSLWKANRHRPHRPSTPPSRRSGSDARVGRRRTAAASPVRRCRGSARGSGAR